MWPKPISLKYADQNLARLKRFICPNLQFRKGLRHRNFYYCFRIDRPNAQNAAGRLNRSFKNWILAFVNFVDGAESNFRSSLIVAADKYARVSRIREKHRLCNYRRFGTYRILDENQSVDGKDSP